MDTVTYPTEKVANYITDHFIPCKVNFPENGELAAKFNVIWTPTLLFLSTDEVVYHRSLGFLPPEDCLAELYFARGWTAFCLGKSDDATSHFKALASQFPRSDPAPQALYWLGVADYRETKNPEGLISIWKTLAKDYPDNVWAKKVSFIK